MATTVTPQRTMDLRGLSCPLVLARIKQALEEMEAGQVLEVLTNDACTEYDIPSWVRRTGKEMVHSVAEQEALKFYIRKL